MSFIILSLFVICFARGQIDTKEVRECEVGLNFAIFLFTECKAKFLKNVFLLF